MSEAPARSCLTLVLAAGEGTRMRSALPKVMHEIAGLPMLGHVLKAAQASGAERLAVVVGPGAEAIRAFLAKAAPEAAVHEQSERRGTAHAVLAARPELERAADDVLVLYGDTPLVTAATLARLRAVLAQGADVAVLGFTPDNPDGYGRLLTRGGKLLAIREHKDASPEELAVRLCNAGLMALAGKRALALLQSIGDANAKREFYLTDVVEVANRSDGRAVVVEAAAEEVQGVNSRAELAEAEAVWQRRRRRQAMEEGAGLQAPETVFFSHDTRLGRDVVIEPNVWFGPGVSIGDGAVIHGFSHIEGAEIAAMAEIGPFARLRPGASIGEKAKIGNFVEVKNTTVGAGAKANHLSYLGDASVGEGSNIGAGTITCNYDGYGKYHTEIGAHAFIGSNSALVAPVTIGEGAYVGTGSVITKDVSPGALAIARARQVEKPGWVERFRKLVAGRKG